MYIRIRCHVVVGTWMVFALVLALGLTSTAGVFAQDVPDAELRQLLIDRVGSLDSLQVPDDDAELPQPSLPGGQVDPLYEIYRLRW